MSAILRTKERFGAHYVIDVLLGSKQKKVLDNNHQELSVFGIGLEYAKTLHRTKPHFNHELSHFSDWPAAADNSLQSCQTLCDPVDGSPPGSPEPGILQARTLEWVAISFSNA